MGIITGANLNQANVSTSNQLLVINPSVVTSQGNPNNPGNYVTQVFESDAGSITGAPLQRQGDISAYYRQRVSTDTLLFSDRFSTTSVTGLTTIPATNSWITNSTGAQTTNISSGTLILNDSGSTGTNTFSQITTRRTFQYIFGYPLQAETQVLVSATPSGANTTIAEIGFGLTQSSTGTSAPAPPQDGCGFRYTLSTTPTFQCFLNFNGSETLNTGTLPVPSLNAMHNYILVQTNYTVEFWVDNILYQAISIPTTTGSVSINNCLPFYIRTYIGGSIPAFVTKLTIAGVAVTLGDMASGKDWNSIMAGQGNGAYQYPSNSNSAAATTTNLSTALYTNSLAVGAGAAATNTTAALGSGLGGQFSILPTLAVPTDGIIQSFQVPAGSTSQIARNLYITGVWLKGVVTTALTGGPVIYAFSLGYGNTSVSLATAEAATTKSSRRIPLGYEVYPVTSAVGVLGQGIQISFQSPIFVQPGEFIQVIAKNLGTVTSAGIICYNIGYDGYWE